MRHHKMFFVPLIGGLFAVSVAFSAGRADRASASAHASGHQGCDMTHGAGTSSGHDAHDASAGTDHAAICGMTAGDMNAAERFDELSLIADQRNRIGRIWSDVEAETLPQRREIEATESSLKRLLNERNPDETRIAARIGDLGRLRGEVRLAYVRAQIRARGVLTADQLNRFLGIAAPATGSPHDGAMPHMGH